MDGAAVVLHDAETGRRALDALAWGLVPSGHKGDLRQARRPVNIRSETLARSKPVRLLAPSNRCIVPADAYYDWRPMPELQPFAVARADGAPMGIAGVWDAWTGPDGAVCRSFAIVTCTASGQLRRLQQRMPVVLEPEDWAAWLGERDCDPASLLLPADDGVLRIWPVSRAVDTTRNNAAELLDEVYDPRISELLADTGRRAFGSFCGGAPA